MDISSVSNFGWVVIGLVVVFITWLLFKSSQKGKKIKTPVFEIGDEDEGKNIAINGKNIVQGSTVYGNVGESTYYSNVPQISPLQRHIYELCVNVLKYAKEHNNMVCAKDLDVLCGDNADTVYQMIHDEKVFWPVHGQRKVGIGKMKTDDINRLITKYRIELSKQ